jgi:hypothetical protein
MRIASPVMDAARPDDRTDRAPLPGDEYPVVHMTAEPPPIPKGARAAASAPPAGKSSGGHVVPRVHPSLQQALGDVDIEDEFDIPTFLRRHNSPPAG